LQHTTFTSETSIPTAGFELALPQTNLPQAYVLDRAATGIRDYGVTSLNEAH